MKADPSPELTLLLMACTIGVSTDKKNQITQFISQNPINWPRLNILADRHRLKPFLYRTLQQVTATPEAVLSTLRNDCRLSATDNLLKLHHYHSLEALLKENSIDYFPLKGVYLAEHGYPDTSLRILGDIDLLIRKEDVYRTIALLKEHEYYLSDKHKTHWQQGEETVLADLFEIDLFKRFSPTSQFDIDLHWHVMGFNKDYVLFDLDYVRSQPQRAHELMIVLLITHHGVNGVWQQINYINDLYFLLSQADPDWDWLLKELARLGFDNVFLTGLAFCCQIWDLKLPASLMARVNSPSVQSLATAYTTHWESEKAVEFSYLIMDQLTFLLKAQPRFGNQLKTGRTFISSRVFRYSLFNVGKRLIYVPKQAGLITLFIRMTQSVFRFFPARKVNQ
ncbi:nucleotidyltransferase domain-containing protein [Spirosoma aerophilum]